MPRRYKRRKRRAKRPNTVVSLRRQPFPKSFLTRHRYCTAVSINPGAGVGGAHYFSANSLFDPDVTGVGHQPLGFDELTPIYNHYLVLGARITAEMVSNTSVYTSGAGMVGLTVDSDTTAPTNVDELMEQGDTSYRLLPSSGNGHVRVSKNFSAKNWFGVTNLKDCPAMHGRSGGNPSERAYFRLFLAPLDGSSDMSAQDVRITIEYITLWTEPKDLGTS